MRTCKSGMHPRKSYTRKAYTRKTGAHVAATHVVPTSCVRGYHGIGKLHKGDLSQFGYSTSKTARSRHLALNAATKTYGPLSVYRKLNALAVYTKRRSPATSKRALADRGFVGKKVGYKH